ncbi:MAG: hypothetical protein IPM54_26650 [Polyangiaceae bacterium]|nr:hypothetical protein [Polyangiaceae bacterium]
MLKYSLVAPLLICLGGLLPACGGAEIGEACETRGSQDECVDDAICDLKGTDETEPVCLKVCNDASECAATEDCNGVSGSNIKACTPKK